MSTTVSFQSIPDLFTKEATGESFLYVVNHLSHSGYHQESYEIVSIEEEDTQKYLEIRVNLQKNEDEYAEGVEWPVNHMILLPPGFIKEEGTDPEFLYLFDINLVDGDMPIPYQGAPVPPKKGKIQLRHQSIVLRPHKID